MSAVEYSYVQLKKDAQSASPATTSRAEKVRQFSAFSDAEARKRVLVLVRNGETLTVTHPESGRVVEVPWSNVAFARRMPSKEEPAAPQGDQRQQQGKFKP